MGHLIPVTDTSFDAEVLKCDIPVLVDFSAGWCAPCRTIAPYLDEIAAEYEGILKVVKLDVDVNPLTPSRYSVFSLPTLILFKSGRPVERITGRREKRAILEKIAPHVA